MFMPRQLNNLFRADLRQIPWTQYRGKNDFLSVIKRAKERLVTNDEIELINLALNNDLTQKQLDKFLQMWDIECYGAQKALLLSYVQKQYPHLDFGQYTGPRLAGLFNYWRFRNVDLLAQYRRIVLAFNEQGIVPLIMKGGAIKYLRPELSRVMNDVDILIDNPRHFTRAIKIAEQLGYVGSEAQHSIDLHKPDCEDGVLDIHRCLDEHITGNSVLTRRLFVRAEKKKVFGTESFVPSAEDLVFIALFNVAKNLLESTSLKGVTYTMFDIAYLIRKENFDWQIVRDNIKLTHTAGQMFLAMTFFNLIQPDFISSSMLEIDDKAPEIRAFLNKEYFFSKYLHGAKYERRILRWRDAMRSWSAFKHYWQIKIQYRFMKIVWRIPLLLNVIFCRKKEV